MASYEKEPALPAAVRPRVAEAWRLVQALREIIPDESLSDWLQTPNPGFGGQCPLELIQKGERDVIWAMIHQTRQGAFA